MTRKRLPKAIVRPRSELRAIAAGADEEFPQNQPSGEADASVPRAAGGKALVTAPMLAVPEAAHRRSLAKRIVERHKMYAAVGGLFPLPIVNVAGVTAVVLRMIKALSDLYDVPFERERTRSIVVGLMAGAAPTGLAAATASTLAVVVPASGLFGLAVSSVTAASLARGIGFVFIERLEKGALSNEGLA